MSEENIARELTESRILVGPCPECGSENTHDCQASEYVKTDARIEPQKVIRMGSTCEYAKGLDAIDIGHCDGCNCLWCLLCGEVIQSETVETLRSLVTRHLPQCGTKEMGVRLWRVAGIETSCLLCGEKTDECYEIEPGGLQVDEKLTEIMNADSDCSIEGAAVCLDCLPNFEQRATTHGLKVEIGASRLSDRRLG